MYNINSTEKKSLQFPAMSDGYVQIPWGDGSNTPAQNVGLWGHAGGITLEFLIDTYVIRCNYEDYMQMSNEDKIKVLEREYVKSEEWIRDIEKTKEMYRKYYKETKDKLEQIKKITK